MKHWNQALLWILYVALLAVLLPHTAWAFSMFEPQAGYGPVVGWTAALAFEGTILAVTWRLKQRIESTPRYANRPRRDWLRFKHRYVNSHAALLMASLIVSGLANWGHAVQFARDLTVFGKYGVDPLFYSISLGAILPVASLLFANVLAEVSEAEEEEDAVLAGARAELREARRLTREAEARAHDAEIRADSFGELARILASPTKKARVLGLAGMYPALPQASIALLTESSTGYVSEIMKEAFVEAEYVLS